MIMTTNLKLLRPRLIAQLGLVAALCACSTPQPVRDLASKGAATADNAQKELREFVDRADAAYKRREALVLELRESSIRDSSRMDFLEWMATEAGAASSKAAADQIRKIVEHSRQNREAELAKLAAARAVIAASGSAAVQLPTEKINTAKHNFTAMAEEMSAQEWLKFSVGYAKQVNTDLKALQSAGAASAPQAAASPPVKN